MVEVVAALIWDKDKFMICQRPAHKARGLLWEFVGGKVEPGEAKKAGVDPRVPGIACSHAFCRRCIYGCGTRVSGYQCPSHAV